jgi:hypothetical protein
MNDLLRALRALRACCLLLALAASAGAGINSWTVEGPVGGSINDIAVHPANSQVVLISSLTGPCRSTDAGVTWTLAQPNFFSGTISFDPAHPGRVYMSDNIVNDHGTYHSANRGAS